MQSERGRRGEGWDDPTLGRNGEHIAGARKLEREGGRD